MRTGRCVRITAGRRCDRRIESQTVTLLRGRLRPASVMTEEAHVSAASVGYNGRRWIIVLRLGSPSEHRVLVDVLREKRLQRRKSRIEALRYQGQEKQEASFLTFRPCVGVNSSTTLILSKRLKAPSRKLTRPPPRIRNSKQYIP